jgi:hypothetical protein
VPGGRRRLLAVLGRLVDCPHPEVLLKVRRGAGGGVREGGGGGRGPGRGEGAGQGLWKGVGMGQWAPLQQPPHLQVAVPSSDQPCQ